MNNLSNNINYFKYRFYYRNITINRPGILTKIYYFYDTGKCSEETWTKADTIYYSKDIEYKSLKDIYERSYFCVNYRYYVTYNYQYWSSGTAISDEFK